MRKWLLLLLALALLLCSCNVTQAGDPTEGGASGNICTQHKDDNVNGLCDRCNRSVVTTFDFYSINDLHGKLSDGDNHPGVDELTTFLKNARNSDDNVILLSAGDMWQGTAESNLTGGLIMTDAIRTEITDFLVSNRMQTAYDEGLAQWKQDMTIVMYEDLIATAQQEANAAMAQ